MITEIETQIPGFRDILKKDTVEALEWEGLKAGMVEAWEDGFRTKDIPNTFEWWYFDAEFDDGGKAVIVFSSRPQTNPKGPLSPCVLLIMKTPDGQKKRLTPGFKPEEFCASADGCDVRIGDNWAKGDLDRYEVHAEIESYAADLVFTRRTPSWRTGSGMIYSGWNKSKYFGWVVPIPYGDVEGTVVFEGKKRQVKGVCYHDHNWGNLSLGNGIDYWYWGRAHVGDFTTIFVEMVTRPVPRLGSLKMHTLLLIKDQEIITDDGVPLTLVTEDFQEGPGGRLYPQKLDFEWKTDEGRIALSLRNPAMIDAINMNEGVSWWRRPLSQLFRHPRYYNFNADLELTVDIPGLKANERGRALYELMMQR